MYKTAKNIARKILPQKFLFEKEEQFRNLLYPFYKGNNCKCNICNSTLKNFEKLENGNLLCPICGSLPRTRRLNQILEDGFLQPQQLVLDFSPSRALFRKLKKNKSITYFPTDYENEFLADYRFDITNIAAEDHQFDIIMCYHILEHIEADEQAMRELYRVLKSGGTAFIQTPFKEGEIYEDYTIKTPEDRLKHFGQDDHVRIYSVASLNERLQKAGFHTEIRRFEGDDYLGFSTDETVIFCTKK